MTAIVGLDKPREWSGKWWLPGDRDRAVAGILRYDPSDGLLLSLIGGLEEQVYRRYRGGLMMTGEDPWPVIHGAIEGKLVTLLDCSPGATKRYGFLPKDAPDEQTVHALTALVGVHLDSADDALFSTSRVSVEDLRRWSNSSVFTQTIGMTDGRRNGHETIGVEPVDEPSVVVDETTIRLVHEYTLPFIEESRGHGVGRMRDTVFVEFEPTRPMTLRDAQDLAKKIQDLVSLATHRAAAILRLRLFIPPSSEQVEDGPPLFPREVEVYYNGTVVGAAEAKAVERHAVLFTCAHIPFVEIVPRWWQVRERFLAASNLVLGLRYGPARYLEGNLLTAVGAAEVMHRALDPKRTVMPADEFKAFRQALVEAAPPERQSWVKSAVRNDPTLRDRLLALGRWPDREAMEQLVPNVEAWAKAATQARNDLAHTGQTPKHSVDELFAIVEVAAAVVVMNLLQALELPAERQREIVASHPRLSVTSWHARQNFPAQK